MNHNTILLLFLIIITSCLAREELSAQYRIYGSVFGGGGGDAFGDGMVSRNTLGQPVAGHTYSPEFEIKSGFWYASVTFIVTSVNELDGDLPQQYTLDQNYPNPFNPATTIRFSLPEAVEVTLVVYDILGRKVTTLVDEYREPGEHSVLFDAGHVASGVYIYQIRAGEFVETKRLMLVK